MAVLIPLQHDVNVVVVVDTRLNLKLIPHFVLVAFAGFFPGCVGIVLDSLTVQIQRRQR